MVESKFVVLQMIPHTLFIEWDFGHCSLVVLLFMVLFTSRWHCSLAVMNTVHIYSTVHIYGTIHTTSFFFFFLNVNF